MFNKFNIKGVAYNSPSSIVSYIDKEYYKVFVYNNNIKSSEFQEKIISSLDLSRKNIVILNSIYDLRILQNIDIIDCFLILTDISILEKIPHITILDAKYTTLGWKKKIISSKSLNKQLSNDFTKRVREKTEISEIVKKYTKATFKDLCYNLTNTLLKTEDDCVCQYVAFQLCKYAINGLSKQDWELFKKELLSKNISIYTIVELVKYTKEVAKLPKLYADYKKSKKSLEEFSKNCKSPFIKDLIFIINFLE
jgi:hypothetical protein